jgi:hypothetical protein
MQVEKCIGKNTRINAQFLLLLYHHLYSRAPTIAYTRENYECKNRTSFVIHIHATDLVQRSYTAKTRYFGEKCLIKIVVSVTIKMWKNKSSKLESTQIVSY